MKGAMECGATRSADGKELRQPCERWTCRWSLIAAPVLLAFSLIGCATIDTMAWQRQIEGALPQSLRMDHFDVHWRSGSGAAAKAGWVANSAERELSRICVQLEVANDTRYNLFLFEGSEDLQKTTNAPGFIASFSLGRAVYLGNLDEATRIHEMVHMVAAAKMKACTICLCRGAVRRDWVALFGASRGIGCHLSVAEGRL
jgi:hypothetical protein